VSSVTGDTIRGESVAMPKIIRGRISGLHGMESHTAEELHEWADRFEFRARFGNAFEDPGWLRRWAKRLRCLAEQKEKAREHKNPQRSANRHNDPE
jgi:hypothetical protein